MEGTNERPLGAAFCKFSYTYHQGREVLQRIINSGYFTRYMSNAPFQRLAVKVSCLCIFFGCAKYCIYISSIKCLFTKLQEAVWHFLYQLLMDLGSIQFAEGLSKRV